MKDYTKDINFWKRLNSFVIDVQTGCCAGEEEKEMIIHICNIKINELVAKCKYCNGTKFVTAANGFYGKCPICNK